MMIGRSSGHGRLTAIEIGVVVIVLVALAAMVVGRQRCRAQGGHYLRAVLWFECVR